MPDIASALKEEITRLARKEVTRQTKELRSSITAQRSQLAALRRKNQELEQLVKRLARGNKDRSSNSADSQPLDGTHRFSAKGLAKHRQRLGLSAADFGALIGASSLSVYKWEKGEARPRQKYLNAIAAARKLGKREAAAGLADT